MICIDILRRVRAKQGINFGRSQSRGESGVVHVSDAPIVAVARAQKGHSVNQFLSQGIFQPIFDAIPRGLQFGAGKNVIVL